MLVDVEGDDLGLARRPEGRDPAGDRGPGADGGPAAYRRARRPDPRRRRRVPGQAPGRAGEVRPGARRAGASPTARSWPSSRCRRPTGRSCTTRSQPSTVWSRLRGRGSASPGRAATGMTVGGPIGDAERMALGTVLERSRGLGFLGPGPLTPQIDHARGFASTQERTPESFLDLGAGGGLPGLVLAQEWPAARAVLLDSMVRRTEFLREACGELGIRWTGGGRVRAGGDRGSRPVAARRIRAGHGPLVRTAGGDGGVRGRVLEDRGPTRGERATCGRRGPLVRIRACVDWGSGWCARPTAESRFVVFELPEPPDERWPRRVGIPAKRPLWT